MIKPEQVPDEVAWKLHDKLWSVGGHSVDDVRSAIAAALNAWPGMTRDGPSGGGVSQEPLQPSRLILPLTQENSDDQ